MEGTIDLHTHSTASDGSFSPEELVAHSLDQGLSAIALTDHDTVDGVERAYKKGLEAGLEVLPGVEISIRFKPELHILGYFSYENYIKMEEILGYIREKREERTPGIIKKLRNLGMDITVDDVAEETAGKVTGRIHIARVLVKKGYARDIDDAFNSYLVEGRPAFVERVKLSASDGIRRICSAGGVPVLAHPKHLGKTGMELETLIEKLKGYGLKGLEVYYSENTREETERYEKLAAEKGLIITGGSDFHGENRPGVKIGRGRDNLLIGYGVLAHLKKHL